FARELSAIFGRPLRSDEGEDLAQWDRLPALPIRIEDTALCPVYGGILFRAVRPSATSLRILRRLTALGISGQDVLINISNYVQLETGQPNHVFDAETMTDGVRVARSMQARRMRTLDGNEWDIGAEDLLIFSGDRPAAIAGVMGGYDTQIRPETENVILE